MRSSSTFTLPLTRSNAMSDARHHFTGLESTVFHFETDQGPFGGFKLSGFGSEEGQAALRSYYQLKNVSIKRGRP